ncbi:homoserine kinase, partial [Fusobacterium nucleatum]|uniref:homoserine kinase n=1 Tax=Fusobacterium nucleatum TaxID=851 RepID=UPI001F5245E5
MFEVRVPMTSANVACGFDTLGIAFQVYSIFDFELSDKLEFVNFEEEFCNEDNLVYIAFKKTLNFLNKTVKGVKITLKKQAPIARGLGSSATCVVAGIYGAYLLTESEINKNNILKIATEIEGHPDNVAPAIFGNLCASCLVDNEAVSVQYNVDDRFNFMALIPNFETKTADARKVLPEELPLKDAIFSLSRLGIVLRSFENYDIDTLKKVLADKIHEPYRKNLIYEYEEVRDICESVESYGFFISGSGSTLINIITDENKVELIK